MKFNSLITSIALTFSTALFVSNSAPSASFTTNLSENQGLKGNILLGSIEQNGKTINQFSFVKKAEIVFNQHKASSAVLTSK